MVFEVSRCAGSLSNDARSRKYFAKVHRAPAVILKKLPEKLQTQWQDVRQLQVLGIVGSVDGFCSSFQSLLSACLIIFLPAGSPDDVYPYKCDD